MLFLDSLINKDVKNFLRINGGSNEFIYFRFNESSSTIKIDQNKIQVAEEHSEIFNLKREGVVDEKSSETIELTIDCSKFRECSNDRISKKISKCRIYTPKQLKEEKDKIVRSAKIREYSAFGIAGSLFLLVLDIIAFGGEKSTPMIQIQDTRAIIDFGTSNNLVRKLFLTPISSICTILCIILFVLSVAALVYSIADKYLRESDLKIVMNDLCVTDNILKNLEEIKIIELDRSLLKEVRDFLHH